MKKIFFLLLVFMLGLGIASGVHAYEGHEGYEAGRAWAAANGIIDVDYDSDDSDDFNEGVRQYGMEQQQIQGSEE